MIEKPIIDTDYFLDTNIYGHTVRKYEKERTIAIIIDINFNKLGYQDNWAHISNENYIEFKRLAQKWKEEKKYISSPSDIVNSSYYKRIIEKGDSVLNYIVEEMKHEPDFWFEALKQITKQDPVKREHWGDLEKMTKDWLDFLKK